ncbi:2405_t:CDS:1, partial [Scutellospora calospora]
HNKILAMSQLRSNILSNRKRSEVEKDKQQYKRIYNITPIQQELAESSSSKSNNVENELLDSNNLSTQLSETSEMNDDVVNDIEENWSYTVKHVIGLLDNENQLDNGKIVDSEPLEFELHGHITHPVDDPLAKWSLLELFYDSLEALVFFVQ